MFETTATELNRLMQCNGSRLMPQSSTFDDANNSNREEGIAAHYMATAAFNAVVSHPSELVDRRAPNGIFMTDVMEEHASKYLAMLQDIASRCEFRFAEHETNYYGVRGRADFIGCNEREVFVEDFKYGFTIVEPEMNWTLIFHAASFCITNQITPEWVHIGVFQPRQHHPRGPHRVWTISYARLCELWNMLATTLENLTDELHTGPNCYKCPSLALCFAARKADMNAVEASAHAYDDSMSNEELSVHLDMIFRAKQQLKISENALTELARHRIKGGQLVENYSLDVSLGNSEWKDGVTPEFLHALTSKDVSIKKLPTPAQAIRSGIPEAVVKIFTERKTKGVKLVRETTESKANRLLGGNTE